MVGFSGSGHVYFEASATVISLVLGKCWNNAKRKTLEALEALCKTKAKNRASGAQRSAAGTSASIRIGDVLW